MNQKIIIITRINVNVVLTKDTKHYSNQLMSYLILLYNIARLVYIINIIRATEKLRPQNAQSI